jgi:hypothetical protein
MNNRYYDRLGRIPNFSINNSLNNNNDINNNSLNNNNDINNNSSTRSNEYLTRNFEEDYAIRLDNLNLETDQMNSIDLEKKVYDMLMDLYTENKMTV